MGDKRRSSLLSLLRGRGAAPKEEKKKEPAAATAFERSAVSTLAVISCD